MGLLRRRPARHGAKADLKNAAPAAAPIGPPRPALPFRVLDPTPLTAIPAVPLDPAEQEDPPAGGSTQDPPPRRPPFAAPPAPGTPEEPEEPRRRGRRRRTSRDPAPDPGVMDLPPPQGYVLRRSARKARRGWYAPLAAPAVTSTKQAAILNTALVAPPTDAEGIVIGRDRLSNTAVAHDPFTAYERGIITSPAVVVLGVIGAGKSSLLKTVYVLRPLIQRGRRVVAMDRRDQGGEGEYCPTARQLGAEPLRFVVGGGQDSTTLNLLDPVVLAGSGVAGQARLLIALAELANEGAPLDMWEKKALRAAHRATLAAAEADQRVPLLEHLLPQLGRLHLRPGQIHPEFSDYSPAAL
jgi:hypothetical protein